MYERLKETEWAHCHGALIGIGHRDFNGELTANLIVTAKTLNPWTPPGPDLLSDQRPLGLVGTLVTEAGPILLNLDEDQAGMVYPLIKLFESGAPLTREEEERRSRPS